MNYTEFVKPELAILIAVLYGLGKIIKNTETIKDKHIPLILTVVGVALSSLYVIGSEGLTYMSVFTGIVQGIICTSGAVYGNQLIKQTSKKE